MFSGAGKFVVIAGVIAVAVGLCMIASERWGASGWFNWIGNLPLDIKIERENFRLYVPIGTSLFLSLLFSLALYLINKFLR
ncbi:MAG: DUF2905 family protein [Chlorobiaceae bacterium]